MVVKASVKRFKAVLIVSAERPRAHAPPKLLLISQILTKNQNVMFIGNWFGLLSKLLAQVFSPTVIKTANTVRLLAFSMKFVIRYINSLCAAQNDELRCEYCPVAKFCSDSVLL